MQVFAFLEQVEVGVHQLPWFGIAILGPLLDGAELVAR